ncbi:hypothetical protein IFR05_010623 [Cadophora sp. M221]|nr:hypothetical protein IFR05_010623 [Cadophora sp. M221]
MDKGVEDILKLFGRDDRIRPLGLSTLSFDQPVGSPPGPSGPYHTSTASTSTIIAGPTVKNISAIDSSSSRSDSDSASRRSSNSTALSTAPSIPLFPTPPWHFYLGNMAPIDYDYELPCEFEMLGCSVTFRPEGYENWVNHSISHFLGHDPPLDAVCTFCDEPNAYVRYPQDPFRTWRARMMHLGRHHQETGGQIGHRPDYFLLEYMNRCQLLAEDDFGRQMSYTERPRCDHLVDRDFQTPEMKDRECRNAKPVDEPHDLRKEGRQRKQGTERGSGKTYKPSENPKIYHGP